MATNDDKAADPYVSSSFIGHSLWVCPTGDAKQAYSEIIAHMSKELGTFQFTPHITLVAAIMTSPQDVVQRTKDLAAKLTPYTFSFDSLSYKDRYFQCVFAKMKLTEEVLNANKIAREVFFERKTDPEYMPHLSFVYGDFEQAVKDSTIIPMLEKQITQRAGSTLSFTVDSIEVWSTQGDVADWYLVETIPLGKP
jgi:Cyclic phosphodiesterase-like protein